MKITLNIDSEKIKTVILINNAGKEFIHNIKSLEKEMGDTKEWCSANAMFNWKEKTTNPFLNYYKEKDKENSLPND